MDPNLRQGVHYLNAALDIFVWRDDSHWKKKKGIILEHVDNVALKEFLAWFEEEESIAKEDQNG